jgi:hypothetical protein
MSYCVGCGYTAGMSTAVTASRLVSNQAVVSTTTDDARFGSQNRSNFLADNHRPA